MAQTGNPQAALMLLEQTAPRGAERGEFHALKGLCEAMLGKPIESSQEFEQALAIKPEYAPFIFPMAWLLPASTISMGPSIN